jgi:hypothetical protein
MNSIMTERFNPTPMTYILTSRHRGAFRPSDHSATADHMPAGFPHSAENLFAGRLLISRCAGTRIALGSLHAAMCRSGHPPIWDGKMAPRSPPGGAADPADYGACRGRFLVGAWACECLGSRSPRSMVDRRLRASNPAEVAGECGRGGLLDSVGLQGPTCRPLLA